MEEKKKKTSGLSTEKCIKTSLALQHIEQNSVKPKVVQQIPSGYLFDIW